MAKHYTGLSKKEKHFQSLQAADLLAKYAREVAIERDWPYSKAADYVRAKHPDLCELEVKGYVDDRESRHYEYTSLEAGGLIAEKAKKVMEQDRCSYGEAVEKVLSDPANKELAVCYTAAD